MPSHACAVRDNGEVWCWGANTSGQLGDFALRSTNAARKIVEFRATRPPGEAEPQMTQVSVGGAHTCSIDTDHRLWCWGNNSLGQVGDGTKVTSEYPQVIDQNVESVSAGSFHTCAVYLAGAVKCWGTNENGRLGIDRKHSLDISVPTPVKYATYTCPLRVVAVEAGGTASGSIGPSRDCGSENKSHKQMWGADGLSQLGDGGGPDQRVPVYQEIFWNGDYPTTALSIGWTHACDVKVRSVRCWGTGPEMGDGNTNHDRPVFIPPASFGGLVVADVTVGVIFSCAQLDLEVRCWGSNASGEIGDGTGVNRRFPTRVVF